MPKDNPSSLFTSDGAQNQESVEQVSACGVALVSLFDPASV